MGAPVTAFCRIDDKPIRLREPVVAPDALIIQDATLLHRVPLFDGLAASGYVLVNTPKTFQELELGLIGDTLVPAHCLTLPATKLGLDFVGRPIPNAALLGGFAALSGILKIESVVEAIMTKFSRTIGEKNVAAARAAYDIAKKGTAVHA